METPESNEQNKTVIKRTIERVQDFIRELYFLRGINVPRFDAKKIDSGNEADVLIIRIREAVIKVQNVRGITWRTQGKGYMLRCQNRLDSLEVERQDRTIHNRAFVQGYLWMKRNVQEFKYVPDFDKKTLKYSDLTDPENGIKHLRTLMELLEKSHKSMNMDYPLGIDLVGGEILKDFIKAFVQTQLLAIADYMPHGLRTQIRSSNNGIEGKLRNIILQDNQQILTDLGLYDLSKKGRLKLLIGTMYHVSCAGIKELIRYINETYHSGAIPEEEIEAIPLNCEEWHKTLAASLFEMMIPLYERYEDAKSLPTTLPTVF